MIVWVVWAVWCRWFEALSRTANEIGLWNNTRSPASDKFHNVPSGKLSAIVVVLRKEIQWRNVLVSQMNREVFQSGFRRKDGWNGNHVHGDGFKGVNRHWFDEGTSRGKLNHFVQLSCSFLPGCASFYLNNSTNQTKLAIRIDRRCIYTSIIA